MTFTYRNTVLRALTYAEGDSNFGEVERMYNAALNAELVATAAANIYVSTAAGLAATADLGYFTVPDTSTQELVIYREETGVAVEKIRFGKPFVGGVLTSALNEAPPVTIASAATVDIGAAASNTVIVSGVVAITALGTIAAGAIRYIRATGAFTLTHNATSLILHGSNIVATVGEVFRFESLGAGNWRLTGRHYAGPLAQTGLANTFASGQIVGTGSGAVDSIINGGVEIRALRYRTAGADRFVLFTNGTAESGSSAGSDFGIARYDDAGGYLGAPLTIKRSDGGVYLASATGLSKGDGTLNAVNLYVQGSAVLKQADIFVSADQTITLAGALTLAHGLGTAPRAVNLALVCQTAELGYSIGDVNFVSPRTFVACVPDATNLNVRFVSAAPAIVHKTTGVFTTMTPANWKARFLAIK